MLGCGDTPVNVVKLLCFKNVTWFKALCAGGGNVTFFGYYIWLQSDAAFYYLRLDKCSFSVRKVQFGLLLSIMPISQKRCML